jgi:hypothetical protein
MREIKLMNVKNPLVLYQRELTKKNVGRQINNWKIIADKTGLPLQTIMSITRLDYDGVLRMSVGVYFKIKRNIGVDMLSFGKGVKKKN